MDKEEGTYLDTFSRTKTEGPVTWARSDKYSMSSFVVRVNAVRTDHRYTCIRKRRDMITHGQSKSILIKLNVLDTKHPAPLKHLLICLPYASSNDRSIWIPNPSILGISPFDCLSNKPQGSEFRARGSPDILNVFRIPKCLKKKHCSFLEGTDRLYACSPVRYLEAQRQYLYPNFRRTYNNPLGKPFFVLVF